jgi:hypothetical protein
MMIAGGDLTSLARGGPNRDIKMNCGAASMANIFLPIQIMDIPNHEAINP